VGAQVAHHPAPRLAADGHHARRPALHRPAAAAYINLIFIGLAGKFQEWLSLEAEPSIWISFVLSMGVLALVMRKG
jgi:hypothetical protein